MKIKMGRWEFRTFKGYHRPSCLSYSPIGFGVFYYEDRLEYEHCFFICLIGFNIFIKWKSKRKK